MFSYNAMLFHYNTCAIAFQMKEQKIVKYVEPLFHLIPLLCGLAIAIPPFFYETYDATQLDAWCVISSNIDDLVKVLCFVFFIWVIVDIILIIRKVFKLEVEIAHFRGTNNEQISNLDRASESLKNTKVVAKLSFAYYLSFLITGGILFVRSFTPERSQVMNYLCYILVPLQGFFNLLIFVFHKVYNYRRVDKEISRIGVIKLLLRGDVEDPILFSRISLFDAQRVEITDEYANEFFYHGGMSALEVNVDEESKQDEDSLSGFQSSLASISNNILSGQDIDNKSKLNYSSADLSGYSSMVSSLQSKISSEQKTTLSKDEPLKHLSPFNIEDDVSIDSNSDNKS